MYLEIIESVLRIKWIFSGSGDDEYVRVKKSDLDHMVKEQKRMSRQLDDLMVKDKENKRRKPDIPKRVSVSFHYCTITKKISRCNSFKPRCQQKDQFLS